MKCILHIGTEKTGTTLIQNWLYENEQALSLQGVGLSKVASFPNNRKLVAYFQNDFDDYMHENMVFNSQQREAFFEGFEEALLSEILELSYDHHTVLFSSEHFHSRLQTVEQIERVKEVLDRAFSDVKVMCYFREQSKVRTSLYSTGIKLHSPERIDVFQKDAGPGHHYYDYMEFFSKWAEVFGKENLVPKVYDRETMAQGDIRYDFLATMLPGIDPTRLSFDSVPANESLTAKQAACFRVINAKCPPRFSIYQNPLNARLKARVMTTAPLNSGGGVKDPRQPEMYQAFDESNRAFFKEFFGTEDNLFSEPKAGAEEIEQDPEAGACTELLDQILSIKGLVFMAPEEVDAIRDLAMKLYEEKTLDAPSALLLLKVLQRARPYGPVIGDAITKIYNESR